MSNQLVRVPNTMKNAKKHDILLIEESKRVFVEKQTEIERQNEAR